MPRLLIVDDDEDFASAAAIALRRRGHVVDIESSVTGITETIRDKRPDLVILDVMFPEDSTAGFTLARNIRQCGGDLAKMPLLMLTAVNSKLPLGFSERDIDEHWLPVSDFLEKPVDLDLLEKKVESLLQESGTSETVSGG